MWFLAMGTRAVALTGYRVTTISGGAIVDAAHIHQFSDSRNNDPRNGIAALGQESLTHWLFDAGLWTLDDDYRVLVALGGISLRESKSEPTVAESLSARPAIELAVARPGNVAIEGTPGMASHKENSIGHDDIASRFLCSFFARQFEPQMHLHYVSRTSDSRVGL